MWTLDISLYLTTDISKVHIPEETEEDAEENLSSK